jgi:ADP-ribose pyrophosphatase YjhB (NUDIX family)
MKCVLIAGDRIAAVSDCNALPTAPGWKAAWYGETYTVGEPIFLFDTNLRRKPIDASSVYGRARAEKQEALETARLTRTAAEKAVQSRKNAEADLEKAYAQVEELYKTAERRTSEEKALLECADTAEKTVLEKEEAEQAASKELIEKTGKDLNALRDPSTDKTGVKPPGKKDKKSK